MSKDLYLNGFVSGDIIIDCSEYAKLDNAWHAENISHAFTRLYFIKRGSGYLIHKGSRIELKPGYAYLIPSECVFSYGCDNLEKIYFHITIPCSTSYDALSALDKIYALKIPSVNEADLWKYYFLDDCMSMLNIKKILYETIWDFSEKYCFEAIKTVKYSHVIKNVIEYIRSNLKITLTVAEIAKEMFVAESTLRKSFKSETGVTVGRYIDNAVFIAACKRLSSSTAPIKQISDEFGFCDQFYFSRRFKELYGKTPTEYRRSALY